MVYEGNIDPNELLLQDATVLNEEGQSVKLSLNWQNQPALLIFLRHFACIECRAIAQQVWSNKEQYEATGAKLAFIGSGTPAFAQTFKEDLNIQKAPIYTDPDLEAYDAAGFKRGLWETNRPASLIGAYQLKKKHEIPLVKYEKGHGHIWQMGGVLAINTQGRITYQFTSKKIGDFPENFQGELN